MRFSMSIRIKNNNSGKIIIIKNQKDMNHLDNTVTTVDDNPHHWDTMDDNDGYRPDDYRPSSFDSTEDGTVGDWRNRIAYTRRDNGYNNYNSQYNLNHFDDAPKKHYIDVSTFSLDDEDGDDSTVHDPLLQLADVDIPDDEFDEFDSLSSDNTGFDQTDDIFGDFNLDDESDFDNNDGFPQDENSFDEEFPEEDENFQGLIRTVRGACLVYKRKNEDNTFEELWIYNVGDNINQEAAIRKAILSGTDIDPNTQMSDDGEQKAKTWTIGNVQYLTIDGLVQ